MKRRNFLKNTAQATAYTLFLSQLYACRVKSNFVAPIGEDYRMELIRGNVGLFTERGGTIGWMADGNGIVVIDTQFPEQANHLVAEITKLNAGKIDLLINTHHHGDHTAGNPVFSELTDTILAHENSKKNQLASAKKRGTEEAQVYPNELFADNVTKKVGKESITLRYFGRGHTSGDAVTHFENANVVHMGDLIFNRRFPYIDMSAGASIENWITVLDKTLNTFDSDTIFLFGHSANDHDIKGGKDDIKAFQNYLEQLLKFGEQSLRSGITIDELKANTKEIPGAEEWKGKGIERSLDAVYAELARE